MDFIIDAQENNLIVKFPVTHQEIGDLIVKNFNAHWDKLNRTWVIQVSNVVQNFEPFTQFIEKFRFSVTTKAWELLEVASSIPSTEMDTIKTETPNNMSKPSPKEESMKSPVDSTQQKPPFQGQKPILKPKEIFLDGEHLMVRFPYDPEMVAFVKGLKFFYFPEKKQWGKTVINITADTLQALLDFATKNSFVIHNLDEIKEIQRNKIKQKYSAANDTMPQSQTKTITTNRCFIENGRVYVQFAKDQQNINKAKELHFFWDREKIAWYKDISYVSTSNKSWNELIDMLAYLKCEMPESLKKLRPSVSSQNPSISPNASFSDGVNEDMETWKIPLPNSK